MIYTTDNNIWLSPVLKNKMSRDLYTICRRTGAFKCLYTLKDKILLQAQRLSYRNSVPHPRLRSIWRHDDDIPKFFHCVYQGKNSFRRYTIVIGDKNKRLHL